MLTILGNIVAALQIIVAVRVIGRIAQTAGGQRIRKSDRGMPPAVSVIVPVLDEESRLGPCLEGLAKQGPEVSEILVVDGGSQDGTRHLVHQASLRDERVRLIAADPIPADWNGKAWGLEVGWLESNPGNPWILCLDADSRPSQWLAASVVTHAQSERLCALSVATRQRLNDAWLGLLHPSMLTTLVYRFGIPGHSTRDPGSAQANGQCMLVRRTALTRLGGLGAVRASRCEDVTLARLLASLGGRVGFFESDDLVAASMYEHWRDAWHGWSRSLPLRDQVTGWRFSIGLLEVTLAQGLPLPLLLAASLAGRSGRLLAGVNCLLVIIRIAVLLGTHRAYARAPLTYWLSPLLDLPVSVQLWSSSLRSRQQWRGRTMVSEPS